MQAGKRQREKLIELIRRLAEDDKDGVMAGKVGRRLELFKSSFCCWLCLRCSVHVGWSTILPLYLKGRAASLIISLYLRVSLFLSRY